MRVQEFKFCHKKIIKQVEVAWKKYVTNCEKIDFICILNTFLKPKNTNKYTINVNK